MRADFTLSERYEKESGVIFLSGIQALARLLLEQHRRDKRAGLNTGGFVCGYRGSPLGAYDQQFFMLEYKTAPTWAFTLMYEMNNKFDEQRPITEKEGPFPAGQVTYTIRNGGSLNLWFGKRQAGYLCSGGVCKLEPAFEGVEFYGTFRY